MFHKVDLVVFIIIFLRHTIIPFVVVLINKQESDLLTLKTRSSPREDTDYPRHQQIPSKWEGNVSRETNIIPLRHKNTF